MRIENEFTVEALPRSVWEVLMDVPTVVSCMPGAELIETIDASHWKTKLTVKVGPVALAFAADVDREVADSDAGRMVLTSKARELKGRGGATARVESTLEPADSGTRVVIVTDVSLSGAAAQFGRPVMQQVSHQLVDTFASCLQAKLDPAGPAASDQPAPALGTPQPIAPQRISAALILRALVSSLTRLFKRQP